jgi:integrase
MDQMEITLSPNFDFRKMRTLMSRDRHQSGYVSLHGKRVKKWYGFYHLYIVGKDGRERRRKTSVVLGEKSKLKKWEAEEKLAAIIAKETGKATRPDPDRTFGWFWKYRFLSIKEGEWSPNQSKTITGIFEKHVLPRFEKTKLRDLNRFDIQILLNELAKDKSESLVDKVFTYFKAAVLEALEQDFLEKNPCRKVTMPKIEHKPCERFLLLDEITTLDQHLKNRDRLIFRLFVLIGFRPGELFALRWEDIQPGLIRIDEAVYRNQLGDTKTEASRGLIPIPPQLEGEITIHREFCPRTGARDFVFEARYHGRPMDPRSYLRRFLKPVAKRNGVEDLTYQALRRTFATHFQKHGQPKEAQAVLRHSNIATTLGIYTKLIPESARHALASMYSEMFVRKKNEDTARVN